jgi:hypothetical protein
VNGATLTNKGLNDRKTLCRDFWLCVGAGATNQRIGLLKKKKKARIQLTGGHSAPWVLSIWLGHSVKGLPPPFAESDPADGSFLSPSLTSVPASLLAPIFSSSNCPFWHFDKYKTYKSQNSIICQT